MKRILALFFLYISLVSCNEREKNKLQVNNLNDRNIETIKKNVLENYQKNTTAFNQLDQYFNLKSVRRIKLTETGNIDITYFDSSGDRKWNEIKNINILQEQNKQVISKLNDDINIDSLAKLIQLTKQLSINRVDLVDFHSSSEDKKVIELRYSEDFSGLHFYYHLFQNKMTGYDSVFFYGHGGGVLSPKLGWSSRTPNE